MNGREAPGSRAPGPLGRVLSTTLVYALAAMAQRGLAFFLLPVYTRYLSTAQYGALELLNALIAILYALVLLGLPGALTKCYHRDCETESRRQSVLWTALLLDLPVLLVVCWGLFAGAGPLGEWLIGLPESDVWIRLVGANGVVSSLVAIVLSSFRAQERAAAFSILSLAQFACAFALNAGFLMLTDLGLTGVLWGNLLSNVLVLPAALWWARDRARVRFDRLLARPLLTFGLLTVPSALAGWLMNLSDRYLLRWFGSLDEVAVYGVGYKVATVLQIALVWPFQLSWPNVAFSIADQDDHRRVFSRTLTYLSLVLVVGVVGLSCAAPLVLPWLAGEQYRQAHRVVPWVAVGYLMNGVFYCVSPALHLAGRTRLFPALTGVSALVNLGSNLVLIPLLGMMGAAISTTLAFTVLALTTMVLGARSYGVRYETERLLKLAAAGIAALLALGLMPTAGTTGATLSLVVPTVVFAASLVLLRFFRPGEIAMLLARLRTFIRWRRPPSR